MAHFENCIHGTSQVVTPRCRWALYDKARCDEVEFQEELPAHPRQNDVARFAIGRARIRVLLRLPYYMVVGVMM
eukprot:scaffold3946_cov177-Amphora_coffeaeformis.AAC.15